MNKIVVLMSIALPLLMLNYVKEVNCFDQSTVIVNANGTSKKFPHFWKSTGFCPPDPKNEVHKWFLSDDVKLNLALIGALPNRGIKQVRVHWLLNLITSRKLHNFSYYNFTYLDDFLDWFHKQKLRPGFEVMGLPVSTEHSLKRMKRNEIAYDFWYDVVLRIVNRYKRRYGVKYVAKWRFETWNEPDLKSYNLLNFTLNEYLSYVNACADGLRDSFIGTGRKPKLGGPAGLFKQPAKHPLCWGFLEFCNRLEEFQYPIQYVSFHKKGDGTAETLLNGTFELLDYIHFKYRNLRRVPIANDEADVLPNWSISENWRGDTRYAAMVLKVCAEYYKKIILERQLKVEVLSNDNGFLNFHPHYFTQRTLLTRFQMNKTSPPHVQFVKKPVYALMGLISLLGDEYLRQEISGNDPLITILASRCSNVKCKSPIVSLLIGYANNTVEDTKFVKNIRIVLHNLKEYKKSKYVIYVLDNVNTNPFQVWKNGGSPPFPEFHLRQQMRNSQEPRRLKGPSPVSSADLELNLNVSLPSIVLIQVCSRRPESPGIVTGLQIFNVTRNEVLLVWKDTKVQSKLCEQTVLSVNLPTKFNHTTAIINKCLVEPHLGRIQNQKSSRCIRTYEVEFKGENDCYDGDDAKSGVFSRVNINDTIFLSYHHATTGAGVCETTLGKYRVRAVDFWGRPGNYSKIVTYP